MTETGINYLRAACIAFVALLASGCSTLTGSIETPTVKLIGLQLIEAGLLEQRYKLTRRINNPNAISLPIKGISYSVRLAGVDFASGQTPKAFRIASYDDSEVDIDVSTNLLDTVRRLRDWFNGSPTSMDYELNGKVQVNLPFVGAVPFSETGSISLGAQQ